MSENQKRKIKEEKLTTTTMKIAKREINSGPQSALRAAKGSPRSPDLQQLYDEAAELEEEEKYDEALKVVGKILVEEERRLALPAKLSQLKMILEKKKIELRKTILTFGNPLHQYCKDIFSLTETLTVSEDLRETIDLKKCDAKLHEILSVFKIVLGKHPDIKTKSILLLFSCRLDLILNFFNGKERLEQLHNLCSVMLPFDVVFDSNYWNEHDGFCSMLGRISLELEKIKGIGGKEAAEKRAWFLCRYGVFAYNKNLYAKAESVITEGINLMKKTFCNDAPKYRVFGYLHKSRIFALSNSSIQDASKWKLWKEVIDMFKQATDWESKAERFERLEEAVTELNKCSKKLNGLIDSKF